MASLPNVNVPRELEAASALEALTRQAAGPVNVASDVAEQVRAQQSVLDKVHGFFSIAQAIPGAEATALSLVAAVFPITAPFVAVYAVGARVTEAVEKARIALSIHDQIKLAVSAKAHGDDGAAARHYAEAARIAANAFGVSVDNTPVPRFETIEEAKIALKVAEEVAKAADTPDLDKLENYVAKLVEQRASQIFVKMDDRYQEKGKSFDASLEKQWLDEWRDQTLALIWHHKLDRSQLVSLVKNIARDFAVQSAKNSVFQNFRALVRTWWQLDDGPAQLACDASYHVEEHAAADAGALQPYSYSDSDELLAAGPDGGAADGAADGVDAEGGAFDASLAAEDGIAAADVDAAQAAFDQHLL